MRKKLTLMFVALFAIAAFAATTWKAAKDTSVEAGTVLVDDDLLAVKTAFKTTLKTDARTIDGQEFTNYIQVRVKADPTVAVPEGTENDGSTSLIITPKRDVEVTFYYRRQSSSGAYSLNDGKDMKVFDQSDAKAIDAEITLDSETDDGNYAWVTKVCKLSAGKVYTASGRGTTIQFYGLIAQIPFEINTLNFNSLDASFPVSTSNSTDGDIVKDLKFTDNLSGVDVTVTPSTSNTPNRFWSTKNGPQLRIYGGTLTFAAPEGKTISKLTFNNGKWNEGNTADSGEFASNVWTGEAEQVVVTIAGNTQLNSIDVEFATDIAGEPIWTSESAVVVNWSGDVVISPENLAKAKVGDIIHVALKDITATGNWSGQLLPKTAQWIDIEGGIEVVPDMTEITFILTGDMLRLANEQGGLMICGTGFSTDKVTLETTSWTGSDTSIWIGDFEGSGNFGINYSHFKNGNLKAGDIVRVTATEIEGDGHWLQLFSPDWSTCIDAVKTDDGYDITLTDEMISLITADYQYAKINFGNYEITQVELIEGTPEPVDVKVSNPGEDLTAAIAEAAAGAPVATVNLTLQKGNTYKLTAPITASGNIVINGNGASIDAIGVTGALFQYVAAPAAAAPALNRAPVTPAADYTYVDNVEIKNVTITGVKGSIYYDNNVKICVENFTIDNVVLGLETESVDNDALVSFKGGCAKDVIIKNSTVYGNAAVAKYFMRYNNGAGFDKAGYDKGEITYTKNTFYKLLTSNGWWASYTRVGNNAGKTLLTVTDNIWVDCADGNIMRRLSQSKTLSSFATGSVYENNTILNNGAAVAQWNDFANGTDLTTDPEFKDAANADFTLGVSSKQMKHKTGDPRWIKGNYVPAAGDVVDITLDFQGGDLTAALNEKVDEIESQDLTVGDITINLSFMSTSTVSEPITVNKGLTIKGDNAVIDASALSQPMIQMNKEPQVEAVASGQYVIKDITIENVKVTGLTKAFFADNGKFYAYETFTVNNCVIEYATQSNVVFNLASSMAINFNITNSTIYSKEAGTANFIAMSGKRPWQITGYEEETGKLTVANNTFYNVAKSRQFMNTNTLKGQKYLYEFNSNIFANVSNKKIYGNMTNKKEQLTTDGKNTYIFDGTFFAETNYNGDEGLQTDPQFTNAEKGDFTIFVGSKQAKYETGDPRWLTYFDPEQAPVEDVELNVADGGNITTAMAMAMADVDQLGDITINVSGDVTISSSIVAPNSLTITGATGATIDASGLEAAMITTPAGDLAEWMEGNLTIEGVNIKGLKKSLFASAGKNYLYKDFKIENSVIEFDETSGLEFDFRKGGVAKNFTIENSTLYALAPTSNSLYTSQSAQRGTEAPGVTTQTFTIKNSTLVNFAKTKNFFTHRQANQTWLAYDIENSIFVDCGKSGQVVKGINQGQSGKNPTWTISGNLFNFDGTDTSAAEATGDADEPVADSVAGVVEFKNAAEGNFDGVITLADGAETPAAVPGDNTNFSVIIADATSIKNVKTVDAADLENAVIFNLNGQRVEKAQKGLYIINGRKVVVK